MRSHFVLNQVPMTSLLGTCYTLNIANLGNKALFDPPIHEPPVYMVF